MVYILLVYSHGSISLQMMIVINPLNPAGRFSGLCKRGVKNPVWEKTVSMSVAVHLVLFGSLIPVILVLVNMPQDQIWKLDLKPINDWS